jgi:hypothetical protein
MQEQQTVVDDSTQPSSSASAPGGRISLRALYWIVLAVPVLALLLAFPLVCSRPFLTYADKYGLTAVRPLFETKGKPCDVLLFGDSSAIIGLDPRVIEKETHMSTCNIAATMPTLGLMGVAPLDSYLDRNPRPRVIVLQFTGADLKPLPDKNPPNIEGIIPMLRYGNKFEAVKVIGKDPDTLIGLLHYTYFNSLVSLRARFITKRYPHFSEDAGAYTAFPKPPLTNCPVYHADPIGPKDIAWLHFLREHFASRADYVLIDVAPTSSCNVQAQQWQSSLAGEIDNQIALLPITTFVDDVFHMTRAGAVAYSESTGREIVNVMSRPLASNTQPHSGVE